MGSDSEVRFSLNILTFLYTAEEQVDRAFNLGLAALLGENVYNFGELVSGGKSTYV